ncbi:hypothetical protein SK128_012353 [Halocaridina rubra]|uniref:C-type lectin domain-containing protein n=1 Tax=Halocaridina rubra TaxID=373956 RepID=A0AAN8X2K4_HALRR
MHSVFKQIIFLLLWISAVYATCPESDQIHCEGNDRCTRIRYICDGDNDCGDNSDEDDDLCRAWRNNECERNSARCTRNGRSDCITISHYCELEDPPCEGSVDPRLCKMLRDEKIQDLESIVLDPTTVAPTLLGSTYPTVHYEADVMIDEFKDRLDSTIRHKDCPQLYTKIGDQCISIFFIGNLTWMESRAFCQAIGGDLLTIKKDLSNFYTILQHMRENHVTKDFWIGGLYKNETYGWQWVEDTDLQLGTPLWAVRHTPQCSPRTLTSRVLNVTRQANDGYCYYYKQAPDSPPINHCTAMTYEHYYYVSDENCMNRKSPLCALIGDHPKQAL